MHCYILWSNVYTHTVWPYMHALWIWHFCQRVSYLLYYNLSWHLLFCSWKTPIIQWKSRVACVKLKYTSIHLLVWLRPYTYCPNTKWSGIHALHFLLNINKHWNKIRKYLNHRPLNYKLIWYSPLQLSVHQKHNFFCHNKWNLVSIKQVQNNWYTVCNLVTIQIVQAINQFISEYRKSGYFCVNLFSWILVKRI